MDPQRTHFNKRCTSVTHSPANPERLLVHFQDGTTHETDIVLGADGIKSVVRDFVTGAGTGTLAPTAIGPVATSGVAVTLSSFARKGPAMSCAASAREAALMARPNHLPRVPLPALRSRPNAARSWR